jgi:hypothetical protein
MAWVRQHWEGLQVVTIAHVSSAPRGFRVRLLEGEGVFRRAHDNGNRYSSRDLAFGAADTLVRHRGGHECFARCGGWVSAAE